MYKHFIKRLFDFIVALLALLCLSTVFLILITCLHFANKGAGVFFTQERPGKNAKIFKVIKFKSMTDERDADGKLLPNEQRITKVGKFLRKTSLDKLPQLINGSVLQECVLNWNVYRTWRGNNRRLINEVLDSKVIYQEIYALSTNGKIK